MLEENFNQCLISDNQVDGANNLSILFTLDKYNNLQLQCYGDFENNSYQRSFLQDIRDYGYDVASALYANVGKKALSERVGWIELGDDVISSISSYNGNVVGTISNISEDIAKYFVSDATSKIGAAYGFATGAVVCSPFPVAVPFCATAGFVGGYVFGDYLGTTLIEDAIFPKINNVLDSLFSSDLDSVMIAENTVGDSISVNSNLISVFYFFRINIEVFCKI